MNEATYTPQRAALLRDIAAKGLSAWIVDTPNGFALVMTDQILSDSQRQDIREMRGRGLLWRGDRTRHLVLTEVGAATLEAWNREEIEERNAALREQLQEDAEGDEECGVTFEHDVPEGHVECRRCGADIRDERDD